MKRSISTLTPQRPHAMHLYEYSLERMPTDQVHHHHHHRCHRRKEKKQKSLDRSPHQLADGEAGTSFAFSRDLSSSSLRGGHSVRFGVPSPWKERVGDP